MPHLCLWCGTLFNIVPCPCGDLCHNCGHAWWDKGPKATKKSNSRIKARIAEPAEADIGSEYVDAEYDDTKNDTASRDIKNDNTSRDENPDHIDKANKN